MRGSTERGRAARRDWEARLAAYREDHPDLAAALEAGFRDELPPGWEDALPAFDPADKPKLATRQASGTVLNALVAAVPTLIGGSADLSGSNATKLKGATEFGPGTAGQAIHFGVREHAMGAAVNGITMHGGLRAFGSTFLIFSDYQRPTLRLAGLMRTPSIFVYTHDSIGLGGDGPTHQPVEHLASLRVIPNLVTWRPADATETVEVWRAALRRTDGPTALVFTRQGLPVLDRTTLASAEGVHRGGYVISDAAGGAPQVILIASGSEVHLCLDAQTLLAADGLAARVVSVPSYETFVAQDREYRDAVLLPSVQARVAVEAAAPMPWWHLVGPEGHVIGVDRFGASAPGDIVLAEYGFTADNVASTARAVVDQHDRLPA
jgi:transketolase